MLQEILSSLPGIISTVALVAAGLWAFFRVRVERSHTPHIELDIDCNLYGPEGDYYIAEVIIIVNNRGLVRQDFHSMILKVRAITEDTELHLKTIYGEQRLEAPDKLLEVEVIKKAETENYLFVEPGVKHMITYSTKLPVKNNETQKKIKYLLLRSKFYYHPKKPHSVERLYSVEQCLNKEKRLYCS
jgi:hypothetical protein